MAQQINSFPGQSKKEESLQHSKVHNTVITFSVLLPVVYSLTELSTAPFQDHFLLSATIKE